MQSNYYWSSTTYAATDSRNPAYAWTLQMGIGNLSAHDKAGNTQSTWPVRGP